jgi:DeoR family fructose operon transcriptional repressor
MLKLVCFDKVFLAANAVDCTFGATTPTLVEAETKRSMIKAAKTVILVADHSKFEQKTFAKICSLDEFSMIITDKGINKTTLQSLQNHTQVVIADPSLKHKGVDSLA